MLIDAHVHIFPKVDGYGPKGHTHGAGYDRIDAGDGIAQDVLPAINENTSHTLQMLLHEMRQDLRIRAHPAQDLRRHDDTEARQKNAAARMPGLSGAVYCLRFF